MRIAYFDCFSGAAGDMILGALIDAGAEFNSIASQVERLKLSGHTVAATKIKKQGLAATHFRVTLEKAAHPHRHLKHILEIINSAEVSPSVRERAAGIFTRLAKAEAQVHSTTIEKVHFHEVGAVDAIIDIVGACLALEMLGIERIACSPIPVGSGTITCEHGVMPIPAPATAELLKGVPIAESQEPGELTTPTGAAILTTLAADFGPMPQMTPLAIGYGAGTRDGKTRPNVLRVIVGEAAPGMGARTESVMLLETNLDDCSPQVAAFCLERVLAAGALDAWAQPILMKKQRPGILMGVLCNPGDAATMERILFAETTTLGVRRRLVERDTLERMTQAVSTRFGPIRMKVAKFEGQQKAAAEYEDCKEAAIRHNAPLREVQEEALMQWKRSLEGESNR